MLQSRVPLYRASSSCRCIVASLRSYSTAGTAVHPQSDNPVQPAVSNNNATHAPHSSSRVDHSFRIRTYKPQTPGLRHLKRPVNDHLWKGGPFRPLTFPKTGHGKGGRNASGRITVRHRGGGHRRRIRTVDFFRMAPGKHIVDRIEYDPNRSAHIALVTREATQRKSYIIAAEGMRAGDVVQSYLSGIPDDLLKSMGGVMDPGMLAAKTAIRGNCLPLHMVPVGTQVFNIGSRRLGPAVFCRSAGTFATVVSQDEGRKQEETIVRLQSGEVRRVSKHACATIGVASNPHWHFRQLGKAGRHRWLNVRPTVRGVAMNSVDHPHGGGRGKSKGNRIPTSPWGRTPAKSGFKTRRKRNVNKWVVHERERNQGKRRTGNK
ncbi:translation protein SH3-like domain-containing protein [Lineolata rhizophorae]|uniref:Large ribosomal subunit protein uL2m n=1 Tax=Lineolata rhizophorae TaxID=578093 RepID=A0A6A6NKW5_9PEZI|nr:translation protein SH3-like domain-containing protein [Lineolata rhizophorae]